MIKGRQGIGLGGDLRSVLSMCLTLAIVVFINMCWAKPYEANQRAQAFLDDKAPLGDKVSLDEKVSLDDIGVRGIDGAPLSHAPQFDGVIQQGATLISHVTPEWRVVWNDVAVRVAEDGVFVVGLDRDAAPVAVMTLSSPEGGRYTYHYAVAQRKYKIQRIEGVPKATVNPNTQQIARAVKEGKKVRGARAAVSDRQDYRLGFQWPLLGRISGVYGSQRFYNGEPRRPHYGVDIARPNGTLLNAPLSGKVVLAEPDLFFSGGTLIIDHGHGLSSTLIHLSKLLVGVGDEVIAGQPIAKVGATGRATGPHLDWRMNWMNARVDPTLLVGKMPSLR